MCGDSRENSFENLAVEIILSPISSICGTWYDSLICSMTHWYVYHIPPHAQTCKTFAFFWRTYSPPVFRALFRPLALSLSLSLFLCRSCSRSCSLSVFVSSSLPLFWRSTRKEHGTSARHFLSGESWYTREWVMAHTWMSMTHTWMSHNAHRLSQCEWEYFSVRVWVFTDCVSISDCLSVSVSIYQCEYEYLQTVSVFTDCLSVSVSIYQYECGYLQTVSVFQTVSVWVWVFTDCVSRNVCVCVTHSHTHTHQHQAHITHMNHSAEIRVTWHAVTQDTHTYTHSLSLSFIHVPHMSFHYV